jgi:putative transposase
VYLKGYGFIKVFRTVSPNGDAEYWATNNLDMDSSQYEQLSKEAWSIECYHPGIKQCCGVAKAQVRSASGQVRHISFSLRALVRLEVHRLKTGVSWYETKTTIIRDAVKQYLAQPLYLLNSTA